MFSRGERIVTAVLCALALLSVSANAVVDDGFVLTLSNTVDTVFYDADMATEAFVVADVAAAGGVGGFQIVSGQFSLTEAQLVLDDSAAQGKPWAVFDDNYLGGTAILTITGDLYKIGDGYYSPTGPLLVAEVTGLFDCYKKDPRPGETNVIFHAIQQVNVIGGEFWSGLPGAQKVTDVTVPDSLDVKYIFDNCWGYDVPITDFSNTIGWAPPDIQVHFTPEPATLCLLVIGAVAIRPKKRIS